MEYTKDLFEKLRPDASVATSGRNFCCIVLEVFRESFGD